MFTAAGGVLLRGPVEKALSDLGEMLRAEGVTALFFPEEDAAAREIAEALVPFGPFNLTTGAEVRGGNTAVTAGFRAAEAAIAETGTIVETSERGRTLLPGLIADVHVSIVPAAAVVARMEEALAAYTPPTRPGTYRSSRARAGPATSNRPSPSAPTDRRRRSRCCSADGGYQPRYRMRNNHPEIVTTEVAVETMMIVPARSVSPCRRAAIT
jgi:hypothetical protein